MLMHWVCEAKHCWIVEVLKRRGRCPSPLYCSPFVGCSNEENGSRRLVWETPAEIKHKRISLVTIKSRKTYKDRQTFFFLKGWSPTKDETFWFDLVLLLFVSLCCCFVCFCQFVLLLFLFLTFGNCRCRWTWGPTYPLRLLKNPSHQFLQRLTALVSCRTNYSMFLFFAVALFSVCFCFVLFFILSVGDILNAKFWNNHSVTDHEKRAVGAF